MALSLVNLISNVSMKENLLAVQTVQATDDLGGTISFSISGGADAAKFTIDASTGALAFVESPDFDVPSDADKNNVYEVEVTASSTSASAPVGQALTVTITAASDALEKSLDLARVSGEKIAEESLRNDAQDDRLDGLDTAVASKASQTDFDQLQNVVDGKASQTSLDTTNTNLTQTGNRVSTLEGLFTDGVLDINALPESVRSGLRPQGIYVPGTTALPVTTEATIADQEFKYWVVSEYGQADLSLAQDDSNMVDVVPKSWIIGDGMGWVVIGGGDGLATVNGKTPNNGNVVITAADTGYSPSSASGLTATTTKGGIDEVAVKVKEVNAALGDPNTYNPVAVSIHSRLKKPGEWPSCKGIKVMEILQRLREPTRREKTDWLTAGCHCFTPRKINGLK